MVAVPVTYARVEDEIEGESHGEVQRKKSSVKSKMKNRYTEDREAIAKDLAAKHGYTFIPPYNHFDVISG